MFGLYTRIRGNANKNVLFEWYPSALQNEKHDPVHWDGRKVQWWMIDGGAGWRLPNNAVVLAGVRFDSFATTLENPRGAEVNQYPVGRTEWYSDFTSKVWVPYIGIQFSGNNYVARLIGSPFASVQVDEPVSATTFRNNGRRRSANFGKYSLTHGGEVLEFSGESSLSISAMANLSVWGELSWAQFRGNGEQNLHDATYVNSAANGVDQQSILSQKATIDYGWTAYAIGLAANLDCWDKKTIQGSLR